MIRRNEQRERAIVRDVVQRLAYLGCHVVTEVRYYGAKLDMAIAWPDFSLWAIEFKRDFASAQASVNQACRWRCMATGSFVACPPVAFTQRTRYLLESAGVGLLFYVEGAEMPLQCIIDARDMSHGPVVDGELWRRAINRYRGLKETDG